jgi:hypothetical protein
MFWGPGLRRGLVPAMRRRLWKAAPGEAGGDVGMVGRPLGGKPAASMGRSGGGAQVSDIFSIDIKSLY